MTHGSRVRQSVNRSLLFAAALVLQVEEYLWDRTAALLRRLGRWWAFAALEHWIARQPPYRALVLFVLPVAAVLPLKEVTVMAFVHGRLFFGCSLFLVEKLIATAIFARLYQLTEPAIVRIGWVRRGRDAFLRLRARLYRWLHTQPAYRRARALLARLRHQGGIARRFQAALRRLRRQRRLARSALP